MRLINLRSSFRFGGLLLFIGLLFIGNIASAGVSWVGSMRCSGIVFYALQDGASGQTAFLKIGGRFGPYELRALDEEHQVLEVFDSATGQLLGLRLPPERIERAASIDAGNILPLSRDDALRAVKEILELAKTQKGRQLNPAEIPPGVKRQIDKAINNPAPPPPKAPDKMTSEERAEYDKTLASTGSVIIKEATVNGHYEVSVLRLIKREELPAYISANITQEDLDALAGAQAEAVISSDRAPVVPTPR